MNESDASNEEMDDAIDDNQFDWLANIYTRHGAINHPSELHGLLIGERIGNLKRTPADWLHQVQEHMGVEAFDTERYANLEQDLINFYSLTLEGVDKDSSSFRLLLPDDDYELSARIESLVVWIRGFLEGLAISVNERLQKMDAELQEILKDFVEICQIDPRVDNDEEGEKEFFEISEYVRIGVLNLYAEFNQPSLTDEQEASHLQPPSTTLH